MLKNSLRNRVKNDQKNYPSYWCFQKNQKKQKGNKWTRSIIRDNLMWLKSLLSRETVKTLGRP